ncbi:uncharacterized protein V1513DRAFT_424639 [Lipomyces chichibuensis]|uniref:uncharacterized protein n=1 Tax=Lipomyces chichibuensis TaxID=1546026 RepID=UPI003343CB95
MRLPFNIFSSIDNRTATTSETATANEDILSRPPTPEGSKDPILLPNEIVLQIFPKKLCSHRETPTSKPGFFSYNEPEFFHTYLTKKGKMGALWVTTMRLMFVPNASGAKGCSVGILDIENMKTIESDLKVWFFLAKLTTHIFTVPFSTQQRAQAFLKLMSNLRFEHKVRQSLPPPYRRKSESVYDCPRPSIDSLLQPGSPGSETESIGDAIEEAIQDEEKEWADNDRHLPTYRESEDAVERYLIDRGLLREDGTPLMPVDSPVTTAGCGSEHDRSSSNVIRRSSTSTSRRPIGYHRREPSVLQDHEEASTATMNELRRISSRSSAGSANSVASAMMDGVNGGCHADGTVPQSLDAVISSAHEAQAQASSA